MNDETKTKKQLLAELAALRRQVAQLTAEQRTNAAGPAQPILAEALRETGAALSSTLNTDEVLDRILEQMSRVIDHDAACVLLIEGELARVFRWRGYVRSGRDARRAIVAAAFNLVSIPVLRAVRQMGQPLIVSTATGNDEWVRKFGTAWVRSYACAPISSRGQVIGFLAADSAIAGFFRAVHMEALQAFANQAAIALDNARLFDRMRRERVRQLKRLKKERNFLSQVLDTTDGLVVVCDQQGYIVRLNRAGEQVSGYNQTEVQGRYFWDLFLTTAEASVVQAAFAQHQINRLPARLQSWLVTRTGEQRLIAWSNTAVLDETGATENIIATGVDLTEERLAEERLSRQNKFLFALHQIALDLLDRRKMNDLLQMIVDHAAAILDAPYCELMLKEGDELVVRAFTANQPFLLGDRVGRDTALLSWQAYDTRQPAILDNYSTWINHRSLYDSLHLQATAEFPIMIGQDCLGVLGLARVKRDYPFTPEQVQQGTLLSQLAALVLDNANLYTAALQELTERKRTEAALRESEARLELFFSQSLDGFFFMMLDEPIDWNETADKEALLDYVFDHQHITKVNQAMLDQYGLTEKEMVELTPRDFFAHDQALGRQVWRELFDQGQLYIDTNERRADGTQMWIAGCYICLYSSDGRIIGHFGIQRDVTARKQTEMALRQANAELQTRNEELDAFARTVAHDLKNPISVMVGIAELLSQDYETMPAEDLTPYLDSIARSGRKADHIIEALLLLNGVRRQRVEVQPLDMASIVAEAQQHLAKQIEQAQAQVSLPGSWPVALGYAPWIEEVWVNYLSNGLKYGGRPPRLALGAMMQEDGQVRFWVQDNGPGLPPAAQSGLFTEFVRLEPNRAEGYGLGLAIVRRIIERLGGYVSVESQGLPGQGCIFSFTLPAV